MDAIREILRNLTDVFRWWVIVAPWEQIMRVRGGKRAKALGAGVHLRIPVWDRIFRQTLRQRAQACKTQTVTTMDGVTLSVTGFLLFSVTDIAALYDTLHDTGALAVRTAARVTHFIATHTQEQCGPADLTAAVNSGLADEFARHGVGEARYELTDYVRVPLTLRMIQGNNDYIEGQRSLDTVTEDGK